MFAGGGFIINSVRTVIASAGGAFGVMFQLVDGIKTAAGAVVQQSFLAANRLIQR